MKKNEPKNQILVQNQFKNNIPNTYVSPPFIITP